MYSRFFCFCFSLLLSTSLATIAVQNVPAIEDLESAILRSDRLAVTNMIGHFDPNLALHKAIVLGANKRIIGGILRRGASLDVSFCGNDGCFRPLDCALAYSRWDLADLLLTRGADPKKLEFSALANVIREGNTQIFIKLLGLEANPNVRDSKGNSLLHVAVTGSSRPLEFLDLLLIVGADVNAADNNGNTPLMAAVTLLQKETVNYLLENGANTELRNKNGHSALMMSIDPRIRPESEMIALANVTVTGTQKAYNEILLYQILRMFITWGADLTIQDNDGNTPLMLAIVSKNRRAFGDLLRASMVDMSVKNKEGETVLDLADRVSPKMAESLRDNK